MTLKRFFLSEICSAKSDGGSGQDGKCILPFKYNGRTFHTCTHYHAVHGDGHYEKPWCAINTTSDGTYISGSGYYGWCECHPPPPADLKQRWPEDLEHWWDYWDFAEQYTVTAELGTIYE